MKWSIENLFKYQFIRPKKYFRKCYDDCREIKDNSNRKLYIVESHIDNYSYNSLVERCCKCYDPNYEFSEVIPSYLIDYDILLLMEEDRKNGFSKWEGKSREKKIDYYLRLKKSVASDPYFKHLKRVANRNKLWYDRN